MSSNVKKLVVLKMSKDAIPNNGGITDGIRFLTDPARISTAAKDATAWVQLAISAVRQAAEPNPWREADDEAIAGELLRQIATKRAERPAR